MLAAFIEGMAEQQASKAQGDEMRRTPAPEKGNPDRGQVPRRPPRAGPFTVSLRRQEAGQNLKLSWRNCWSPLGMMLTTSRSQCLAPHRSGQEPNDSGAQSATADLSILFRWRDM